jgi:hypothetical protein
VLFDAAGLDMAAFEPIPPTVRPRAHSDTQAAWRGVLPHRGNLPVRVEATALDGKVVFFETVTPYDPFWSAETGESMRRPSTLGVAQMLTLLLIVLVGAAALFMAARNYRLGRGDRRGAFRIALVVLSLRMLRGLVGGHHVPSLGGEFTLFVSVLGGGLILAVLTWVLYMALEPSFRRLRPRALVGWTRVLTGRLRDPLVGRDVLIGLTFGVALQFVMRLFRLAPAWLGMPPQPPDPLALDALAGGRRAVGELFQVPLEALAGALGWVLMFMLLRIVLRRQWLAVLGFCVLCATLDGLSFAADPSGEILVGSMVVGAVGGLVLGGVILLILLRFGMLALVASFLMSSLLFHFPLSTDPAAPYFGISMLVLLSAMALSVIAFRIALGGRRLLGVDLLADPA